jgi:hypothetical protein
MGAVMMPAEQQDATALTAVLACYSILAAAPPRQWRPRDVRGRPEPRGNLTIPRAAAAADATTLLHCCQCSVLGRLGDPVCASGSLRALLQALGRFSHWHSTAVMSLKSDESSVTVAEASFLLTPDGASTNSIGTGARSPTPSTTILTARGIVRGVVTALCFVLVVAIGFGVAGYIQDKAVGQRPINTVDGGKCTCDCFDGAVYLFIAVAVEQCKESKCF